MFGTFLISKKLNGWDKVTIILYTMLSLWVWSKFHHVNTNEDKRDLLFWYTLGTHLFLYFFNYRSLRNLAVCLFWLLVGIVHLVIYFQLKDNPELKNVSGHAAAGFRNTIILLVLFQVLRLASLKWQQKELVAPSRSRTDLFDERNVTFLDFICFVVYFLAAVLLLFN